MKPTTTDNEKSIGLKVISAFFLKRKTLAKKNTKPLKI